MHVFRDVRVVAHRGASAYEPEHTVRAYDLALAQGADAIEIDVRPTADGGLLLVHDATLLRTVGDPRSVVSLDRAALGGIEPAVRPLTLDGVLAGYGLRTRLLIDLKDPTPSSEARLIEAIDRHGLRERAIVQSFDGDAVRRMAGAAPWLVVAPLYPRHRASVADLDTVASYAAGIGAWHGAVDADLLDASHARGLTVWAWTVDAPEDMRRLLALGVDGLITNVPDVAAGLARPSRTVRAAA
jgi:glycerophosphoryl diester phosphodiesterase